MSTQDKEKRAQDALIVSRLRFGCSSDIDPTKIPVLSEKEKASLQCLKPGFIESIIRRADEPSSDDDGTKVVEDAKIGNRELVHGMNRADEIDQETEEELDRKRRELQDKMREERHGGRDCKGG